MSCRYCNTTSTMRYEETLFHLFLLITIILIGISVTSCIPTDDSDISTGVPIEIVSDICWTTIPTDCIEGTSMCNTEICT